MKAWLKDNWKFLMQILAIVGSIIGANAAMAPATNPQTNPEVWVVMDAGVPAVKVGPVEAGEWIPAAKTALAVAIKVLEHRAPQTPSEWDDRLLALLKLFASDRSAFEAAEAAAQRRAAEDE